MGRKKLYDQRFLIGLDKYQAMQLRSMSKMLSLTYSEVIGYIMDRYQLGEFN